MPLIVPELSPTAENALSALISRLTVSCSPPEWAADPAAVKRARITSRRVRTALELFYGRHAGRLVAEIDKATNRLGALRDLDVVRELVAVELAQLGGDPAAVSALAERFAVQRGQLQRRVERRLGPEQVQIFARQLALYVAQHNALSPDETPKRVLRRFRQAQRRAGALVPGDFVAVHRLRRSLRRLRYDLEALEPWFPAAKPAAKPVRRTLDVLGAMADSEAALGWLRRNADLPSAGEVRANIGDRLRRELDSVPDLAAPIVSDDFRLRLIEALDPT
jgi:CHAD domain-containing protein